MKRRLLMLALAIALIIPCAVLLSSCVSEGPPEETGITVLLNGSSVSEDNKTIQITYGDYQDPDDVVPSFVSVFLDFDDGTQRDLLYGSGGYSVSGLPEKLNANEQGYDLSVKYKDHAVGLKLVVDKAQLDMSRVQWSHAEFSYDGNAHGVELYNLPDGVTVAYQSNSATNAGTYTATAELMYDAENYELVGQTVLLTKQWTIGKAQIDMAFVRWGQDSAFTYDGEAKSLRLENVPEGVSVTYSGDTATNAGKYSVTAELSYDELNFELVNVSFETTKEWEIEKAELNLYGARWFDTERIFYDKEEKSVTITGLPDGVTATYKNNKKTNAGKYVAEAVLVYDSANYVLVNQSFELTCEWEIEKAPLYAGTAKWNYPGAFTYDGKEKTVSVLGLPAEVTISGYTGTVRATNAGMYTAKAEYSYDDANYYITYAPEELQWEIVKAQNTVSGTIGIRGWTYGDTPETPAGLRAEYGEITYKYFVKESDGSYREVGVPTAQTDAGTYYVAGFSLGDDNRTAQQSEYKKFVIDPKQLPFDRISTPSVRLETDIFVYTGAMREPTILDRPDESIVAISGTFSATDTGTYEILFSLKDKTNYCWATSSGLTTQDRVLEWSIIDNPVTFKLNGVELNDQQFDELAVFTFGDEWEATVDDGYSWTLAYRYKDHNSGSVVSSTTSDRQFTVTPTFYLFEFRIGKGGELVYSKTVSVDHDIFDGVTVGDVSLTYEEFVADPVVGYGKQVTFGLKAEYAALFALSENGFTVTGDKTVEITYYVSGSPRTYQIIDIVCSYDVVESFTVGTQAIAFDEFIANPVVLYGKTFTVNLKEGYEDFSSSWNGGKIKQDTEIIVYAPDGAEAVSVPVVCNGEFLTDIMVGGETLTFAGLCEKGSVSLGDTISFAVNEVFSDSYEVYVRKNNGQQETPVGGFSFTFGAVTDALTIIVQEKNASAAEFMIFLLPILIENVSINGKSFALVGTNLTYNLERGETSLTIAFDEALVSENKLSYRFDNDRTDTPFTRSSLVFSDEELGLYLYIYLSDENGINQVLSIRFNDFTPIKSLALYGLSPEFSENRSDWAPNWNQYPKFRIRGVLSRMEVEYTEEYSDCTFKVFDPQGTEIENFVSAVNGVYTLKIYSGAEEIYSLEFTLIYDIGFLFPESKMVQEADVQVLLTSESTLSKAFEDTQNYSDQSVTFDGEQTKTLAEGRNIVAVVYKTTANGAEYTFTVELYVEYTPQADSAENYVTDITIRYSDKYSNDNSLSLEVFEGVSTYQISLPSLLRVAAEDIEIAVSEGNSVLSKEIVADKEKNWLCYLEYTVQTSEGEQKTYRVYLNTNGDVSDNVNVQVYFKNTGSSEQDITSLIAGDTFTIEKVNITGEIYARTEDEKAYMKFYYEGEPLNEQFTENMYLEKAGDYLIEIVSSDNTVTRRITISVTEYDPLIFEVFYGEKRLYLENGETSPVGNVNMVVAPDGKMRFIGYFGEKDPEDTDTVTLRGHTVYEDALYTTDMTPVPDVDNVVMTLLTDADGSVTGSIGVEYVSLYIGVEDETIIPIYFVFAEAPANG